jgi:hypothetical protein
MKIKSAKYFKPLPPDTRDENIGILLMLEGDDLVYNVAISKDNRHYRAIQEWVDAGNTIADAD